MSVTMAGEECTVSDPITDIELKCKLAGGLPHADDIKTELHVKRKGKADNTGAPDIIGILQVDGVDPEEWSTEGGKGTTINDLGGGCPSPGRGGEFWRPLSGKKKFRQPRTEEKKFQGTLC